MPLPLDEPWWNDPKLLVPALLGVVSASLDGDPVQWHRIDTITGHTTLLGVAGPVEQVTSATPSACADATLPDGATGMLTVHHLGGGTFSERDLMVLRSAAMRLAGREPDQPADNTANARSLRRLLAVPDERMGVKELLLGAGPPALITVTMSTLDEAASYRPAALLLLSCVVAAVLGGVRSAVLSTVAGTVALWWAFTPQERSWSVATRDDALGVLIFLAASIGVTLLVMRLDEVRAHDHVERQLADVLLAQSPEATAVFDRELRFRRVNDAMARMNGVAAIDHIGRRTCEVSPIAAQMYEHLLARVRDEGIAVGGYELDLTIPALGLERHWVMSLRPLWDADMDVVGIGAAFTDVTSATLAHRQAAQMLQLAEALSEAGDAQQIADNVCAHLATAFGAHAAVVLWADHDAEVQALHGLTDHQARAWFSMHGTAHGAVPGSGEASAVSYPLRTDGAAIGGIQVAWDTPHEVSPTLLALLGTVSSLAGLALDRVAATDRAHQDQFRHALESMLDEVTIGRAIRGPSGTIDDFLIEFVNDGTSGISIASRPGAAAPGLRLCDLHPEWRQSGTFDRFCDVVDTGHAYQVERLRELVAAPDGSSVERFRTLQVARLGDGYIAATRDVTDVVAAEAALHTATLLAASERSAIDLLQAAAIPRALPQPPGVRMAAMYEPADRSEPIGGDWYDAFELADGRLALVIADVAGHGRDAAVFMVQVRNVFRALADEYHQPGEVLTRANDVTSRLIDPSGPFVTCCFAILDRSSRTLTWALAGHFSPLVLHADGTSSYLPEHPGPPLALTPHRRYVSSSVVLQRDDRILLFTDGLVERRREHLDVGLARLAREASAHAALDPEHFVRALARSVTDRFDDLALLCVQLHGRDLV